MKVSKTAPAISCSAREATVGPFDRQQERHLDAGGGGQAPPEALHAQAAVDAQHNRQRQAPGPST